MKEFLKKIREKEIKKGNPGYLQYRKKMNLIKMLVAFGIVLVVFVAGIIATGTRNNIMTVMTVVLVLPAAKFAVGYIIVAKKTPATAEFMQSVKKNAGKLGVCYDLIFSNSKNLIGTQAVVVTDTDIFAYTSEQAADAELFKNSLEAFMKNDKLTVHAQLFKDEKQFLKRISVAAANFDETASTQSEAVAWNLESLKNMCL